jgi:hypothetical protein
MLERIKLIVHGLFPDSYFDGKAFHDLTTTTKMTVHTLAAASLARQTISVYLQPIAFDLVRPQIFSNSHFLQSQDLPTITQEFGHHIDDRSLNKVPPILSCRGDGRPDPLVPRDLQLNGVVWILAVPFRLDDH